MKLPKAPAIPQADSARPDTPRSIVNAVRLMYAGAALTAIGLVISVIAVAAGGATLRSAHPHATAAQLHATQSVLITVAAISGLVEVAAWVLMARLNRAGLKWARIVASLLFLLNTWNLVSHLIGSIAITNLVYTALLWLVGLAAIFFLWQRESTAHFA